MSFEKMLTLPENLYWAWLKFRRHLEYGDFWYDEAEVARFEGNLKDELEQIAKQFKKLRYRNSPITPLPHPKATDETGKPNVRQVFWIPVRDQVAWIAFVNVVGPWLDYKMRPWSYGNRLYRSVWVEEKADTRQVHIGWYRHTSGNIYRTFRQSWPLFRRHIFLTAKAMTSQLEPEELDEAERRVLEAELDFPDRHKLPYLKKDYWLPTKSSELYWASIDLEKFYPNLSLSCIRRNLSSFSDHFKGEIDSLAGHLLRFPLDLGEWDDEELKTMELSRGMRTLKGVPTGLAVAGFLANVGLLDVDAKVSEMIMHTKRLPESGVAHFRYVDDHLILSRKFEDIVDWINNYETTLRLCETSTCFNYSKILPKKFADLLSSSKHCDKVTAPIDECIHLDAKSKCWLDAKYPSPLMTKTLGIVSNLARKEFDLLEGKEQEHFLHELEHLLLADFPDTEIRKETRIAFAATMISRIGPSYTQQDFSPTCAIERDERQMRDQYGKISDQINEAKEGSPLKILLEKRATQTSRKLGDLKKSRNEIEKSHLRDLKRDRKRLFNLLLKAVHGAGPEKLDNVISSESVLRGRS